MFNQFNIRKIIYSSIGSILPLLIICLYQYGDSFFIYPESMNIPPFEASTILETFLIGGLMWVLPSIMLYCLFFEKVFSFFCSKKNSKSIYFIFSSSFLFSFLVLLLLLLVISVFVVL